MSKCVCGAQSEYTLGPIDQCLCSPCYSDWLESPGFSRGGGHDLSGNDSTDYLRQLHDWLETRRRERMNGTAP